MEDLALRIGLVALVLGGAAAIGLVARRRAGYQHPGVSLDELGFEPGIVIFTATGCDVCAEVRAMAAATGANVREVTNELEAALFDRAGVVAVPLTAVVGRRGDIVRQFTGVPRRSSLQRSVKRAGLG